ncbi:MAG: MFS transporter [Proteobacteria bacterium]|nr:MFS transporter [Pseudomonadota bacterium]
MAIDSGKLPHPVIASGLLQVVLVFAMTLPMLILYATSTLGPLLSRDLHFEPVAIGYLMMSSFGLAAILSLWAGAIVDCIGARIALLVLFCAIAVAFALLTAAQTLYSLIAAAAICGIAQALANPATNLLIAQQIRPEHRAKVVGLKQSGVQLAALFAGLALPAIAFQLGWRAAFGVIVPVAFLFGLAAFFVTSGQHTRSNRSLSFTRPNAVLSWLMVVQFSVGLALSAFVTFLPVFATQHDMPLLQADRLIAVFGVAGMLSRIMLTPLGAKLNDESYLLFTLIAVAAAAIVLTMQTDSGSHWRLWMGAATMGLSAVATNAIAMSMLIRDSAFGLVTVASSYVSVAFFSGFALGPPIYGVLSRQSGDSSLAWSVLTGVLCLACVMTLRLASARKQCAQISAQKTNAVLR